MIAYEEVEQAVESVAPIIAKVAQEVWQLAELSLLKVKSAALIVRVLEENGFRITSRGTAGVTFISTIEPDQAHPSGLREHMIETCQREFFAEVVSSI